MQWVGGTSGSEHDWSVASNWSCGFVPGAGNNVYVPLTANNPAIGSAVGAYSQNLTVDSGVVITVGSSATLNVTGNLTNNGTISGDGTTILNGSTAQSIGGLGVVGFFELNNTSGATISSASRLTVDSALTLTAGTLTTNDSLVLGADTTHSARLAAIASGASISGKARVMQHIRSGFRRYRFWSHPFSNTIPYSQMQQYIDVTGARGAINGFTTTGSNAPSAFRYTTLGGNSTLSYDPGWRPVTSALSSAADTNQIHQYEGVRVFMRGAKGEGLGYAPYNPTATVIGQWGNLNQGRQLVRLVKGGSTGQDYNLLGNPYAAPVDLGTVLYNAKAAGNIIGGFYVWNPVLGAGGAFESYPISTVSATPYYLGANTAFEVRAAHNNDTLVFNESDKGTTPTEGLLRTASNYTTLNIYDNNYHLWDRVQFRFDDNATDEQDEVNDVDKLIGGDLYFYSLSADGRRQAIDVRPYNAAKVIPLGIISTAAQDFIIRAEGVTLPEGGQLFLHDKLLNQYVDLVQGAEYHFTITKDAITQGNNRFELGMKPAATASSFDVTMAPNPASDDVKLTYRNTEAGEVKVRLMDLNGVTVYSKDLGVQQAGVVTIPLNKFASGIYMVELTSGNRKAVRRLVKE